MAQDAGKGLDIEEVEAYLDALDADRREAEAAAVAGIRARGGEPAPTEGQVRAGLPLAWFTLLWTGERSAEVRLGFQEDGGGEAMAWGGRWPLHGAPVEAEPLLSGLCAAWPTLASAYLTGRPDPSPPGAGAAAGVDLGVFGTDEGGIVVSAGGLVRRFGSEGVILIEVLAALADQLASRIEDTDAAARWAALRTLTDLPPIDVEGDATTARDAFADQTAWYAGRLGVDLMDYSLAAVTLHARQVLHGVIGTPEPAPEEWDPGRIPADLDQEKAMDLARRAASALGDDLTGFMRDAVAQRNWDARQRVIYRAGRPPAGSYSAAA